MPRKGVSPSRSPRAQAGQESAEEGDPSQAPIEGLKPDDVAVNLRRVAVTIGKTRRPSRDGGGMLRTVDSEKEFAVIRAHRHVPWGIRERHETVPNSYRRSGTWAAPDLFFAGRGELEIPPAPGVNEK